MGPQNLWVGSGPVLLPLVSQTGLSSSCLELQAQEDLGQAEAGGDPWCSFDMQTPGSSQTLPVPVSRAGCPLQP